MEIHERSPQDKGRRFKDLSGQVFGRLTVLSLHGFDERNKSHWNCRCSCGERAVVEGHKMTIGKTKSCGCFRSEVTAKRLTTHGHAGKIRGQEYKTWEGMLRRCNCRSSSRYSRYGGRGIKVCERWSSFENFLSDMGSHPGGEFSIERIDNNGNYEPANCRWATREEQGSNKRNNIHITFRGETLTVSQWARRIGMSRKGLLARLVKAWTIEESITTPILHN